MNLIGGDNSWGARTHVKYVLRGDRKHQLKLVIDQVLPKPRSSTR